MSTDSNRIIRLGKCARELNVGIGKIIVFLEKKGYRLESSPNARLTEEMFAHVVKEFGGENVDISTFTFPISNNSNTSEDIRLVITKDGVKNKSWSWEGKNFLGVIKFFDKNKDFGFIASNNCNMPVTAFYEQDFYVNSESFIENGAKIEHSIVVFQVEVQNNGKKRAINVRRVTKSEEDANLALSYYGNHEWVEFNNNRINLYSNVSKPIKSVAELVKSIIISDKKRSPKKTAEHFDFFVKHYKKIDGKYIFERYFSTEDKSIWDSLLEEFTDDERVEILNMYPTIACYFDNTELLQKWVGNYFTSDCTILKLKNIKSSFKYLPDDLVEIATQRIEEIADVKIKELYAEISTHSDIDEEDLISFGFIYCNNRQLLEDLSDCLRLTSKEYNEEKERCIISLRNNKFIKEIEKVSSRTYDSYGIERFFDYVKKMHKEELKQHVEIIEKTFVPIIDKYISDKSYIKAANLLNRLSMLDDEFHTHYREILHPIIIDYLAELIHSTINEPYSFKNNFIPEFQTLLSIYNDYDKEHVKQLMVPVLHETKSLEVLSSAVDVLLPIDDALTLARNIIFSWSYEEISKEIKKDSGPKLFYRGDPRYVEMLIERAMQLIGNISLSSFFDGTPTEGTDKPLYRNPERENCEFLKEINRYIPYNQQSVHWNNYVKTRSIDDLLIMIENDVIDTVDDKVIVHVIDSISLDSVSADEDRWYHKPLLNNAAYKKVLESASIDLFPLISNRLLQLDLSDNNNLSLAVLLAELLIVNKPKEDYYTTKNWEEKFQSQLTDLKNDNPLNYRLSVIIWAVYFMTSASMKALSDIFTYLPPYIQIRCVKKLFQLMAQGKINHTAESLYGFISKEGKVCLPLEIAFAYLRRREKDSSATLDNSIMLKLLDNREDYAEWIGIRQLMTDCFEGRWAVLELDDNYTNKKRNNYFNGIIEETSQGCLKVFVPYKMIDVGYDYGYNKFSKITEQKYNNKYFHQIIELIKITYKVTEYQESSTSEGVYFYFNNSYKVKLYALARCYNLRFTQNDNYIDFESIENADNDFCECRLADKLDNRFGLAFYWCDNRPCFRSPVRFMLANEWEQYTILDFMRILKIPVDYVNKEGKITTYGHYIILSSYLGSFKKYFEHLKCRECGKLMKPADDKWLGEKDNTITNFAAHAVTEFKCVNEECGECKSENIVYLNHCFNKDKCKATIDSRDSKRCPNGQYICPECGACCSTENFSIRIENLHKTGGPISPWLIDFVNRKRGHWEKQEYYCYKCGERILKRDDACRCGKCDVTYKQHKETYYWKK